MNGTNGSVMNWIDHQSQLGNRLTINGRLYSYNTRGGSLVPTTTDM